MSIAFLNLARVQPTGEPGQPATPQDFAKRGAEALAKVDTDKSGKLSLAEILAAVGDKQPRELVEKSLVRFDRDGDRELDLAETTEALQALGR